QAFDQGPHDIKPQAKAAVMANRDSAFKRLENAPQRFRLHSNTLILHLEGGAPFVFPDVDLNWFTFTELDGVGQEVRRDLRQSVFVPLSRWTAFRNDRQWRTAACEFGTKTGYGVPNDLSEVNFFELEVQLAR